ncbi:hypothetical protein [Streptomyces sp. NPDC056227]|uniref:hypothetical protein n=1 Tax=Streptomyces sp. NPDC056227 TaxID=3345753 RepID=UPI0035D828F1
MAENPASPPPTPVSGQPQGVTLVVSRAVDRGEEDESERLTHEIASCAGEFFGHNGVMWLRPQAGQGTYHSALHFTSEERLVAWVRLPQRME